MGPHGRPGPKVRRRQLRRPAPARHQPWLPCASGGSGTQRSHHWLLPPRTADGLRAPGRGRLVGAIRDAPARPAARLHRAERLHAAARLDLRAAPAAAAAEAVCEASGSAAAAAAGGRSQRGRPAAGRPAAPLPAAAAGRAPSRPAAGRRPPTSVVCFSTLYGLASWAVPWNSTCCGSLCFTCGGSGGRRARAHKLQAQVCHPRTNSGPCHGLSAAQPAGKRAEQAPIRLRAGGTRRARAPLRGRGAAPACAPSTPSAPRSGPSSEGHPA